MSDWYQIKMKIRLIMVNISFYFTSETVDQRCSVKKVFLEILQNSPENICKVNKASKVLVKLQAWGTSGTTPWHKCFPVNFFKCFSCETSKNTSGGCFCHLSKYFDKLYGNVVYKMQIQMSNFIQVPASLEFAAISEFWFLGFSRHTIFKLITAAKAFLIAFLVKINNKKPDQIISKLSTFSKYFTCSLILFCTCGTLLNIPGGYLHYNW